MEGADLSSPHPVFIFDGHCVLCSGGAAFIMRHDPEGKVRFLSAQSPLGSAIYAHYGPIMAGSRIVVASNDGYLRFFNPVDGALVHQVEVPGGATTTPVVAGQTLYVVSTKGQLHAFR